VTRAAMRPPDRRGPGPPGGRFLALVAIAVLSAGMFAAGARAEENKFCEYARPT